MKHTYFFESLTWVANGTYYDDKGNLFDLTGEVCINHSEDQWTLGGYMEVAFEKPVKFTNNYLITKTNDLSTLNWQSHNPALGVLKGKFEIAGNYIISFYTSEDGIYSGTETLIQVDEYTYHNVGVSLKDGKKMSSWTTLLKAKT